MRLRLLLIFFVLMATALLSLGVPRARGIASEQAQMMQLDRLRDVVRFASLADPRSETASEAVGRQVLVREIRRYRALYGIDVAVTDPAGQVYGGALTPRDGDATARIGAATAAALAGRVGELPTELWPWDTEPLVVAEPIISDGDVVGAVISVSDAADARGRVLRGWLTLGGLGLLGLAAAMAAAAGMARWVLRPVRSLEGAAHGIAEGDFATRVAGEAGPPELRHLARSFNEMADHVQAVLAAQRTFVADASHQLRNPLNALLLRLEAMNEGLSGEAGGTPAAAEAAAKDGRHLAATLDRMLEMARAEHATIGPSVIDVAAVVDERLASWRVVAVHREIDLRREGDDHVTGWQVAESLAGAVDAVVDNALKYSPGRGVVTVHVTPGRIDVTDDGPGLSPEHLPMAATRGWREGGSDTPGTGLGLAIAAELLERHGGALEVGPREGASGLRVRLVTRTQA